MQPADTVGLLYRIDLALISGPILQALTRMYNQPTMRTPDGRLQGTLYKNPIDCLWKTFKTEGVRGWYKGRDCLYLLLLVFIGVIQARLLTFSG